MAESPASDSYGVVTFTIYSNDSEVSEDVNVISISTHKAINQISSATIVLADGDMPDSDFPLSNEDTFKPGASIKINVGYDSTEETVYEGVIVKHGIKITGNNYSRLIIECRDKSVAMALGRKNVNYVDSKDSDIITTLIGNYSGLSSEVDATTVEHKEMVQYYCTDWDFMLARAEANGLLVCVDDASVSVKVPQTDSEADLVVTYGESLMEFHADVDARTQLKNVKGVAWDPSEQAIIEEEASAQTLNSQGDLTSSDLADVIGLDDYILQSPIEMEKEGLAGWASGQQIKSGLARVRGRMKFQGSSKAKIGGIIELDGVGNRFKGNVFVSAVMHEIINGNWVTEVEFGMSPVWSAEYKDSMAPPASGLLPGVDGLQIGVVQQLDQDPDGQYKIQVKVPIMQAETEGVWARLASFYASESFGAFFIPEINDEVVLGFLNNNPCYPVILGSLYSSKNTAPYDLTADNYTKALVTKSQLKVEFDDENKVITIITPGNNQAVLSDEGKSILLQDQNGNKVELNEDGITLNSAKDVTISASGKVSITATDKVSVTSSSDVSVSGLNISNEADSGFTAKGNATAELSASGQTTVKGAMVMIN